MSVVLYINSQLVDLEPGAVIAQTKQVNDINSISTRQANYTNTFKLPKTANNVRVMDFMTMTGNSSNVPYQKNLVSLYSHTGECFVYNGQSIITDGGDGYEVAIIDGIIDLYKIIENLSLADLGSYLTELTHTKDLPTVISTWNNPTLPYRYILADYNGNTGLTNQAVPDVNIDYLVPSVNVAWLWNKIFEKYNNGVLPTGAVFDTFNFKELWMTYPKGISESTTGVTVFASDDYRFIEDGSVVYQAKFNTSTTNTLYSTSENIYLKVAQSGSYRLNIKGILNGIGDGQEKEARIYLGKNGEGYNFIRQIPQFGNDVADGIPYGDDFDYTSDAFFFRTA